MLRFNNHVVENLSKKRCETASVEIVEEIRVIVGIDDVQIEENVTKMNERVVDEQNSIDDYPNTPNVSYGVNNNNNDDENMCVDNTKFVNKIVDKENQIPNMSYASIVNNKLDNKLTFKPTVVSNDGSEFVIFGEELVIKGVGKIDYARVLVKFDVKKGFMDKIVIQYRNKQDEVQGSKTVNVEYMNAQMEFSKTSGLMSNLGKSTIIFYSVDAGEKQRILSILHFQVRKLRVKYLGIPLLAKKIGINDCKILMDRVKKKEYRARVHVKSKLHYLPMLKDGLGTDRYVLFKETCFGCWLDLTCVEKDESLIHYMLQKQKIFDNDHYDLSLIYNVNGHTLHFGRREFCLISGFKFGFLSFCKFREGDITFRDRVFPEKIGEYVKNIDLLSLIEDEDRFISLSNSDSVRVCLLLALEVIFMRHELGSAVDDVFLKMVEDLDIWNNFPWGEYMWRELYGAIRNVNLNHKQEHLKALEINPNFVPTYSLSGFLLAFKIWILESSGATGRWWYKCSEAIPRGCSWSKHFPLQSFENYGQLFPDAQSEWFRRSTYFFKMYTPRAPPVKYGGLFGSYLKKLSLAKTLRENGGDADPVCLASAKDVSLKDRVKTMEGLCTILMILPKEIKSLSMLSLKKQKRSDLKQKDKLNSGDKQCDIAKKDPINELVDALDDLVDEDDCRKNQKLEAENKRLAEQRTLRFHKMKEEENSMKSGLLSNSTHMKLALEKCGTNKRRYVNVLRPPLEEDTDVKVLSIDKLKKQNNVLDEEMIEKCQQLKQWDEEDLNRPFKCIDKVYCNFLLEQFLVTSSWRKFKFPWCNDIIVDGRFWDSLIGLDDKRLGWLLDDHIELWVWYMWHFRQTCHDWSIVSCYFLTLLLQDSMPYFYVTDEIYPISWKDVEQVFIPINEPKRHWSLALFHISSGSVTFYDSQKIYDVEYRPWYLKMRSCLETKLPVILQRTGVFVRKGIDPNSYSIKFSHAENVPQQGGVFGDCGVFLCLFLYRLVNGIPLAVEDPIQMALAYREKLVKFYFEHKIIYES
ncbi:phospholipase-like protein [Tanacetum coccineum]|uniref:Phospholipase-like protein n=1 Tax=Tanacetum coccineum TaxID=301880 RepID=A0ABQ5FPZ7_9ASTR